MSDGVDVGDLRSKQEKRELVIENPRVFDSDYIPEKVLHRKNQIEKVANVISRFVNIGNNKQTYLHGPNSTGKSMVLRWFEKHIDNIVDSDNYEFILINCSNQNDWQNIAISIAEQIGVGGIKRGESAGTTIGKLYKEMDSDTNYIIALDEFDKLPKKSRSKLALSLSRPHEVNHNTKPPNILTLISGNDAGTIAKLDKERPDRTHSSSFIPDMIKFPRYDAEQLKDIFEQRVQNGLNEETFENGAISLLAGHINKELEGDIRLGLRAIEMILENYIESLVQNQSDDSKITEEAIRESVENVKQEILESKVLGINHVKITIVLNIIAQHQPVTSKQVREAYNENYSDSKDIDTIRRYIRKLKQNKIVDSNHINKNEYEYQVAAPFDKKTALKVVENVKNQIRGKI